MLNQEVEEEIMRNPLNLTYLAFGMGLQIAKYFFE